jgi:hypothetical protein
MLSLTTKMEKGFLDCPATTVGVWQKLSRNPRLVWVNAVIV